jgi:DNA-binding LytR/AlgR family response regulator
MMTCIAIDDEPLALHVIRKYATDTPLVQLVNTFTDAIRALAFLKTQTVDLIILDIRMPDIDGIQFLRSLQHPPMVIFTTAYSEYAVTGFELEAVDYLVKPIKFERFVRALEKAATLKSLRNAAVPAQAEEFLFVKSGYGTVCVNFSEIRYIEGLDDYVKIHFINDQKPVMSQISLKSILEKLPEGQFLRVHRSFIVALKQVRSVRNRQVYLDTVKIPVGDTYAGAVQHWISGV